MTPTLRAIALLLGIHAVAVAREGGIEPGRSQITVSINENAIDVFTYRPANCAGGQLLIVMHGLNRNADDYRDHAVPLADSLGMLVAAPRFDAERFPTDAYQRGNLLRKGAPRPKEDWTYSYIPKLVEEIRLREGRADMRYSLIGHSAGGQFLARFAAFMPGGADRIVAANPGSHLFPTRDLPFPYGFGGLPPELGGDDTIRRYLAAPLTLLLGTADTGDKNRDDSPDAVRQGVTRIERGRACFRLAGDIARRNGWPFHWRLVEIEGIGHDGGKMFASPEASRALRPGKSVTSPP